MKIVISGTAAPYPETYSSIEELRDCLSKLTGQSAINITMSVDMAYLLSALALRGASLPRTDEERRIRRYR